MKILLIYHQHLYKNASTISEHVESFEKYINHNVLKTNTELGFPKKLSNIEFDVIILHYSLFGRGAIYELNDNYVNYIKNSKAYKVAFFQDEYHFCQKRFSFLNDCKIDSVYTLLDPKYYDETYYKYTNVKSVYLTLTGYVDKKHIDIGKFFYKPYNERTIDISYRARELPYYMGKEAQEKVDIAKEFIKRLEKRDLKINIDYTESSRLYGDEWYKLIANSKVVIGVEAGVSIFDIDGRAQETYENFIKNNPKATKEEIFKVLEPWEGKMYYRTISPRVFEAASFKVLQVLFEGEYQGILKPMVHYIPLKKDFLNFEEVLTMIKDETLVNKIIDNAYNDLILSGKYSYQSFIEEFEKTLPSVEQSVCEYSKNEILLLINKDLNFRYQLAKLKSFRYRQFIGRKYLVKIVKYVLKLVRK
ncbi:hypothetical protein [Sulfurospirillum arcachonense]|uniref:hypothetical protein n=1 Tax=Sulfurospirillum arcachonense TaxID=57666 RepID=UPI00046994C0|nr:hypothetical protein [Sulfurospirillum arcachonense]